jgi:hypothetical protein
MTQPLTAELFARAVVASARSYGDDPIKAIEAKTGILRRCLAPAVVGIAGATREDLRGVCTVLGLRLNTTKAAISHNSRYFVQAESAAMAAVRAYMAAPFSAPLPGPTQKAGATPEPPAAKSVPTVKPTPPAARPSTRERAIPRGARFEDLGGGVQRIRLQNIPPSVARHAQQQIEKGADLDYVADCFGYETDSLVHAIAALGAKASA